MVSCYKNLIRAWKRYAMSNYKFSYSIRILWAGQSQKSFSDLKNFSVFRKE